MTHDEAVRLAGGYAWGREDASDVKTAVTVPIDGSFAFAGAFAAGYDDFNSQRRSNMIPVKDAYETWQASGGTRIFAEDDTTQAQIARRAAREAARAGR